MFWGLIINLRQFLSSLGISPELQALTVTRIEI